MSVTELTAANIQSIIDTNEMVIIDFWAPWCGPCVRFAPIFESVATNNPDVKFVKLNTDEETDLAGKFGIKSIPTLAVFKEQELIFLQPGALPEDILQEIVTKTKEVDMAQVRAEMAKEQGEE